MSGGANVGRRDITPLVSGMGDLSFESLAGLLDLIASNGGAMPGQIASTQTPQQITPALDSVYNEIPLRGVFWFNSHAFNLTDKDTLLEARVNYLYAKTRVRETCWWRSQSSRRRKSLQVAHGRRGVERQRSTIHDSLALIGTRSRAGTSGHSFFFRPVGGAGHRDTCPRR